VIAAAERRLVRLLRVPPPPAPPAGGGVQVFRAARNYYRYRLLVWALKQLGALWGLYIGIRGLDFVPELPWRWMLEVAEVVGVASYVALIPVTLLAVGLDYRMRWYIVTDRSLRIREGVFRVHEKTMSFANVQNLGVRQGPLQRLLGLADVEVRTAGGGEKGTGKDSDERKKSLHVGYFEGVDRAEEIKALILERLRRLRDSGLGDPEEAAARRRAAGPQAPSPVAAGAEPVLAAARALLAEARALRAAVAPGDPSG